MPELPEVEITVRNLNQIIQPTIQVQEFIFFRKNLRTPIPIKKIQSLKGQRLLSIYRRAKYIIFEFESGHIVSHLGMTGSWRVEKQGWRRRTHDHIVLQFSNKKQLIYNDPRRFGEFSFFPTLQELRARFLSFGPEPLAKDTDWESLTKQFKKIRSPIKTALMNQKYLVGVGNIYANEALFRCGVRPQKKAQHLTINEYQRLWQQVQLVLQEAIRFGGSSLQDFRNGYGKKGHFQRHFLVYDRNEKPCKECKFQIKMLIISGRSTFWCSKCQK